VLGTDLSRDAVITLSVETWDDMVRREFVRPPDRLAVHLRSTPRVHRLLIANPWRSAAGQLRRRRTDSPFPVDSDNHLVRPIRMRRQEPVGIDSLRHSYALYSTLLRRRARTLGLVRPVLVTFNPLFAAFGDHNGFASVTYVARDDWASYYRLRRLWPAYRAAYERIRQRRIRVAAVSTVLLDRIDPGGPAAVVSNGVDRQTWGHLGPSPQILAGLPRPIAMYTGTVDERLSIPAFRELAEAVGTIVVVGPRADQTFERLRAAVPKILAIPSVGQRELAALVGAADLCVIPHVRSTLTEAMSPLKLYEYLAAGRPVVTTDLPPVRGIHPSVQLASEGTFAAAARAALDRGPMSEADRQRFVDENCWDTRCESILDLMLASDVSGVAR